jgi:hypothetical protein
MTQPCQTCHCDWRRPQELRRDFLPKLFQTWMCVGPVKLRDDVGNGIAHSRNFGEPVLFDQPVCLSKIKAGHIGGAARRESGGKESARPVRRYARTAHPSASREGLLLGGSSSQNNDLLPQRQDLCLDRCPRPKQIDNRPHSEPDKISHEGSASPDSRSTASQ